VSRFLRRIARYEIQHFSWRRVFIAIACESFAIMESSRPDTLAGYQYEG